MTTLSQLTPAVTRRTIFDGQKLRALRKRARLDVPDLAYKLKRLRLSNVPHTYVANALVSLWESGAVAPDANSLWGLCRVLGCRPEGLSTEHPDPAPMPDLEEEAPLFGRART